MRLTFEVEKSSATGPRVLVLTEHLSPTYYISFHYALGEMADAGECSFAVLSQNAVKKQSADIEPGIWVRALVEQFSPDLVIFSRYAQPLGREFIGEFAKRAIPIVYHIDDDLLNIPESLGAGVVANHGAPEVVGARRFLLEQSNLIYASTRPLAELLRQRFPHKPVMSGMYAPYFDRLVEKRAKTRQRKPGTIRLGYMGSKGHARDLKLVVPALERILREMPNVSFETFGTIPMPEALLAFGDRITSHRVNANYQGFLQQLYDLDWDVGIAPLIDDQFNQCKAPTKYIEYTLAGIVTVASDSVVYSQLIDGGNGRLTNPSDWYDQLREVLLSVETRRLLLAAATTTCSSSMHFDILKDQVRQVLHTVSPNSVRFH
jgi:glycosyltransferase involved in cell wall biosynthesis